MSRKDYKLLAKAIAEALDIYSQPDDVNIRDGISVATYKICDALILDNTRFNKETFLKAIEAYRQNLSVNQYADER